MVTTNPWLHFGEAQKALLAVLRSPSRQQKGLESERQANQEFQVFVHVAGSATRVLWVSQHTTVVDVCCALGGEDAGAERNCWWFETTLARRIGPVTRCRTAGSGQLRNVPPREQHFSGRPPAQKKAPPQGCPEPLPEEAVPCSGS